MSWPHVVRGQKFRIPAGAYNAFIDNLGNNLGGGAAGLHQGTPVEILVKNAGGTNLAAYSVVGLTTPVVTPSANLDSFKYGMKLNASTPTETAKIGVLSQPLRIGETGRAVVKGYTVVKVNVIDSSHEYCGPTVTYGYLTSSAAGNNRIIYKESGTGQKWAVVSLGEVSPYVYIPDVVTYTQSGIVNLLDQSLGRGRKIVESLGVGYIDAETALVEVDAEANEYNTSVTPGDIDDEGISSDPSKPDTRLRIPAIRVDNIDLGDFESPYSYLARIEPWKGYLTPIVGSPGESLFTLGVTLPALRCGSICVADLEIQNPSNPSSYRRSRSFIQPYQTPSPPLSSTPPGPAGMKFVADYGFNPTFGSEMTWEYGRLTVQGGIDNLGGLGIINTHNVQTNQIRLGNDTGIGGDPLVRVRNSAITGDLYDVGQTGSKFGLVFRKGFCVGIGSGGVDISTETSGDLDGSRVSGTVAGANVGGVQCGSNVITFNEGSR